jgi:signal transduction histidine kinase
MKNVLRFIGVIAIIVSLSNVIVLALKGYNENIVLIGASVFITVVGFVLLIAADNMQIRLTDKQIADAITSLERQSLRDKMAHWGDELNEEEIERLSREGINQMVGDIPRPLFIQKIKKLCGEQNQNWH